MLNALVTLPQHPGHDDQEHERDPQHQQPELQRSVSAQLDSSQAPARSAILLGRSHACVEEQQRPLSAHAFSVDGRQTTVNGRVARILFVAVSRAAAIVLLALLVALPALDAVSFAFRRAVSGSIPSLRDRFAIAKSRSPISSSARVRSFSPPFPPPTPRRSLRPPSTGRRAAPDTCGCQQDSADSPMEAGSWVSVCVSPWCSPAR